MHEREFDAAKRAWSAGGSFFSAAISPLPAPVAIVSRTFSAARPAGSAHRGTDHLQNHQECRRDRKGLIKRPAGPPTASGELEVPPLVDAKAPPAPGNLNLDFREETVA